MNHYEIITKLIGPIKPVFIAAAGIDRIMALGVTIDLVETLLKDIREAAEYRDSPSSSNARQIGKKAQEFLDQLKDGST
jgi:hypothetical protein